MNKQLLRKFINRQCTPDEMRFVQDWLVSTGNDEEVTALLKASWEHKSKGTELDSQRKEEVYQQLMTKMQVRKQESSFYDYAVREEQSERAVSFYRKHWWKLAGVLLLVTGLFATNRYWPDENIEKKAIVTIQKVNSKGQKSTITLKDGSKVYLNSESSIKYLENYGQKTRSIELTGEAFFEVVKDPLRPFIVKSGKITTTALGTSFNVRAFQDEPSISVSLATGSVKVESDFQFPESEKDFILNPGEEAVVDDHQFIRQNFDARKVLSWKEGVIYFDDTKLFETLKELERWYDVTFKVKNLQSDEDIRGTGSFKNQSLENVLQILGHSMKFEFEIKEREVTLNFK
ncbi:FecR domain-containing protein [Reichenbachiella sp. MALMAid0571]|uniref:FecR family protein n=1 Tax=Reichenbachiella sp. MALMAid0571 TaxID=3143939 RepID=UPI0032DEF1EA